MVMLHTARYYAVYPSGRRCEVSLADVERLGEKWEAEEGVTIETDVDYSKAKLFGKINYE